MANPLVPPPACPSPSRLQFISGVGQGSVSLVRHTLGARAAMLGDCLALTAGDCTPHLGAHLSGRALALMCTPSLQPCTPLDCHLPPAPGWTLTSISGFSQAFARAVDSAVVIRTSTSGGGGGGGAHRPPPAHLGHGLTQGVASLAEGVAAGLTGVVRAPLQGYSSGSGVLGGIGRGLLGAVGLPVRCGCGRMSATGGCPSLLRLLASGSRASHTCGLPAHGLLPRPPSLPAAARWSWWDP